MTKIQVDIDRKKRARQVYAALVILLLKIVVVLYFVALSALYFFQRSLEYIPNGLVNRSPKESGLPAMRVLSLVTEDNLKIIAWFQPPKNENGDVVVFYHGAAGTMDYKVFKMVDFLKHGYGVFMCEYRGYGGNPGEPTEAGLYADARAGIKWLAENGYGHERLVLYGESLGTGVAVQMASEIQPKMLALEAPYSSTADVAASRYPIFPVRWLMHDPFDSVGKIAKVKSPLLIVHGDQDVTVPTFFGRKLFAAANEPKTFHLVKGAGHDDLYNFGLETIILNWMEHQPLAGQSPAK